VVLATAATVIASQATISGAFSMARQAVQLDLLPRVTVLQTSETERGQIYVPATNVFMLVAVAAVRAGLRLLVGTVGGVWRRGRRHHADHDRARRAGRGDAVAVAGVARRAGVRACCSSSTLAFVAGNATKIDDGGWVPLVLAAAMFTVFMIWRDGRLRCAPNSSGARCRSRKLPERLAGVARVPGTAVFLVSNADFPTALLRNLEHNHVCTSAS
jgi:KUP system potassium uptake protein